MAEEKNGVLTYQAQSPDEGALVSAARNLGFIFKSRTPTTITAIINGQETTFEVLNILDFNNDRKRMSVIIRMNAKIVLFCKGADSVIKERLDPSSVDLFEKTEVHLTKFAEEALRTLCLAWKEIPEERYKQWKQQYHEASTSLDNRQEKVSQIYEEIETNLLMIGASAIEDKLQDGVPECIAKLAKANIKIWVLTGDKQETAINIGYSCQLITPDMDLYTIDGSNDADVFEELKSIEKSLEESTKKLQSQSNDFELQTIPNNNPIENFDGNALVINGHSLVFALTPRMEKRFLEVACKCKAVICCRVTPGQKKAVVDLVKKHKKAITLAVGDGANDVSMIKSAHIGVGISGQEGQQAVLASDFSIGQFRYLERLLLVHGRWSYYRISKFLRYFFYKNFASTLCHFWFAFFCGFSAQV
jgi:phospholipid-translocating ATPase